MENTLKKKKVISQYIFDKKDLFLNFFLSPASTCLIEFVIIDMVLVLYMKNIAFGKHGIN